MPFEKSSSTGSIATGSSMRSLVRPGGGGSGSSEMILQKNKIGVELNEPEADEIDESDSKLNHRHACQNKNGSPSRTRIVLQVTKEPSAE
ncbi:uncharacterized protein G2W53_026964 [Senna tora]|uniref:Uncharacterized protein n=1 Tax=Senna tora TaxID=362788 RepID=A0A834WLU9_9FABA|nr:uncharacterized protein G2W53_026964 [Senna tora]